MKMMRTVMTMNKTIFKQYDSRWGGKAYPSGSTVSGCGCGLLACVHMAIEQTKYKDYTPNSLREWMVNHGFAVKGQGTTWNGITLTLKHLGYSPKWITESMPMTDAFKELDKGNRIGIILFYGGYSERKKKWYKTPDGTVWTGNGHYVMFSNYKVKGGKHYFYTKDSGARNHSGWYCYETSMKGCVGQLWIAERVGEQVKTKEIKATDYRPSKPYGKMLPEKTLKMGSKGKHVKRLQRFLNWIVKAKLDVDGIFGEKTEYALMVYQKTYKLAVDGIFGSASLKKAKKLVDKYSDKTEVEKLIDKGIAWAEEQTKKGYVYVNWDGSSSAKECPICHDHKKGGSYWGFNCIGLVSAYLHHGLGLTKIKCANNGFLGGNDNYTYLLKNTLKKAQKFVDDKVGKGFKVLKDIEKSDLEAGDILIYYKGNAFWHIAVYVGSGKIIDSSSGPNGVTKRSWELAYPCKVAIRYIGK